ncbi:hypothetical protein NL54_13110 [Pantoea stewartii]|uniref:hypothetical protein n=1 Tax=Pantoea stewartii TaxID=66269 RepID=UPI0005433F2A|nr:hypothetical protein [Pantoea stewartii]KHE00971.1 hypothetical protein NL54_13110 [Pantoea stewartii]KHN58546.1 hypothetical protein OI73_21525 [Pantoea stewartii]
MLQFNGAPRTLITWFTFFLAWSALVLCQFGQPVIQYIMSHSDFFAYDLAMRSTQNGLTPQGMIPFLMALLTLTAGAVLSVLTLLCWNVLFAVCGIPALAVCWLLKRAGFIRKIPG